MLKVSDTYIIGTDITEDDEAVMTVAKTTGSRITIEKTFVGSEALRLHSILSGLEAVKKPVIIKNYGRSYCPDCGASLSFIGQINFCPSCGQAVDWSRRIRDDS